jgi:cyclopropane-fatty-acyl-phospholipid synthase
MDLTLVRSPDTAAAVVRRCQAWLADAGVALPVRLWDGRVLGPEDRGYRIVLARPWALRAMVLRPTDLRLGETYLAGAIDVEGSMVAALRDLADLRARVPLHVAARVATAVLRLPAPPRWLAAGRVSLTGRVHDRERDAAAVRHHYDVGNDFYRLVLDQGLVYSCAYFDEVDRLAPVSDRSVLDRAQRRKLELICRKLHLAPGQRLLDIGCGWGSLVLHAALHHGVDALGITLSGEQAALARERVAAAGLQDRVRIVVRDYRDVRGRFDAIASVGMVEHVGVGELPRYAQQLHRLLVDGGRLLNHGITTGGRDVVRDFAADPDSFVGRYVFPDGALVPAHHVVRVLEQAGFEIWDVEQLRPHYARTLRHWVANLEGGLGVARALVGDRTARIWRAYLAGSVLGFEDNDLGVVQVLGSRGAGSLPFGRAHQSLDRDPPALPV